ncbi:hypothetical protein GCM10011585_32820 [Edaphobacter dinghuensis]|uniref:Uncharacterized protein n=1 Tax=Edaphobacter dinghuensis TaxID=1560005 RepID=A0A917M8Q5_9BACT|nr:hypothetical protein GCM10011585_32820 [Edaphobacter dinghuensis]
MPSLLDLQSKNVTYFSLCQDIHADRSDVAKIIQALNVHTYFLSLADGNHNNVNRMRNVERYSS